MVLYEARSRGAKALNLLAAALLAATTLAGESLPPLEPPPQPLRPGTVAVFRALGPAPSAALTLAGLDQEAGFYIPGKGPQAVALLAVPLGTKQGKHSLTLRLGSVSRRFSVQVGPDPYPVQRLKVPGLAKILASPEHAAEKGSMAKALRGAEAPPMWRGRFVRPVPGTLSSPFGARRRYNKGKMSSRHKGVDLRGTLGQPVRAGNRGIVTLAITDSTTYGGAVVVDHGGGLTSAYLHLGSVSVREGQMLKKGQVLGSVGQGGISTGPHLHWQIGLHGHPVHPMQWLAGKD